MYLTLIDYCNYCIVITNRKVYILDLTSKMIEILISIKGEEPKNGRIQTDQRTKGRYKQFI